MEGRDACCGSMQEFASCLHDCELGNIGFKGPSFTWKRGQVFERLDKAAANSTWVSAFPDRYIMHLSYFSSDHRPLLLWGGVRWVEASARFRVEASFWHEHSFKEIIRKKFRLHARLLGIDVELQRQPSSTLEFLYRQLWDELNGIYIKEELVWFQRSRQKWLVDGDRNTRFYHSTTLTCKRRNKILSLKNEMGEWITKPGELKNMVLDFYRKLYTEDNYNVTHFPLLGGFPKVTSSSFSHVQRVPGPAEIREVCMSMDGFKAPGPDGMQVCFLQAQWNVIKESLVNIIRDIFIDPRRMGNINRSSNCLIPKEDNPDSLNKLRPISLCNVVFKVVTKILANRLKLYLNVLILPNQCSFIKGRHSSDNIIIAQEIFHSTRLKKGGVGWMAIKVDLEKAYDKVNWDYLRQTLQAVGLNDETVNLIMEGVTSTVMNILWERETIDDFMPTRGIRQGDPLSPYLFVLCIDRLAHLILEATSHKLWKPVVLKKNDPPISHLFFTDDLLLFAEASVQQATIISKILKCFCDSSGQRVSKEKTRVIFSRNVNHNRVMQIAREMDFPIAADLGKYLGIPILSERVRASTFAFILDRMDKRLNKWNRSSLSLADDLIPELKASCQVSNLWRGVMRIWSKVVAGSRILIGNGCETNFLRDRWLPLNERVIIKDAIHIPEEVHDWTVDRLVSTHGNWNWDLLYSLLSPASCASIASVMPPSHDRREDYVIWGLSGDGMFSVKSAYHMLTDRDENDGRDIREKAWLWKEPKRVQSFLWLALGNNLLTNERRVHRHLTEDNVCPKCNEGVEDLTHVLRECKWSKALWGYFDMERRWPDFFSSSGQQWIIRNLESKSRVLNYEWRELFGVLCWLMWRDRNSLVFEKKTALQDAIIRKAKVFVSQTEIAYKELRKHALNVRVVEERLIFWKFPQEGWCKLNFDGSCLERGRKSSCGE
ncbi:uncharacterized protein LOC133283880 [Gastrolobium bilobum]|uniref:uncharacterized protein LOC133283880 n=1 Tax=Gastrolobium bilobum TaxID=150636 RepID=UPI002AB2AC72|nr:uncharacterized protein LOC133283880 [Gastrolobium bilobum]